MITREAVLAFVESELADMPEERKNFNETDSLDQLELVIECEREYSIEIDESELVNFDTEMFVDYLMKKIGNENKSW